MNQDKSQKHELSENQAPTGTVTFLFTDVQDSTRLWEKYPAAMGLALQRHDEIIELLAEQHHGYVVRPRGEGDSRFVAFERAIDGMKAAAEIQQSLYAEAWPEEISLQVRIGLHTGEGEYRDGDYYGTAVNRCARLRGLASGGQVLLSQTTHDLVLENLPPQIELLDLGEHFLEGLMRGEHVYQLMSPGLPSEFPLLGEKLEQESQIPAFLQDEVESITRPVFVAREGELGCMDRMLDAALNSQGQILFVTGGPGRGKTALLDEFSWRAVEEHPDLIVARGNCNAYSGIGDPYLPFREIIGMLTGNVKSNLAMGRIQPGYARRLWNLLPETVDAMLERGSSLVDVFVHGDSLISRITAASPDEITRIRRLKEIVERHKKYRGELEQSMIFEQFTNVLQRIAESHPLVLVLDDMQWADRASISLLFHLGRRIEGHPIFIIAAYRPEEIAMGRDGGRHPLEGTVNELKRTYGEIILDLSQVEEDQDFIDLLIDTEPNQLSGEFRKALKAHTGGHPLFTIELLRAMQERGDLLINESGEWIESLELNWDQLPARVEAVIEERINRLEDDLRELLSVASVEGEDFTAQVVGRVQQINERQLLRQLSQELGKRHRLVRENGELKINQERLFRYRFSHHLFQRFLYNDLSAGEKCFLHQEVGEVLEGLYGDAADDYSVELAMHFIQAGMDEKAIHYLVEAGHQAQAKYANEDAIDYYSRALELMPDDHPDRFDVLLAQTKIYDLTAQREKQKENITRLNNIAVQQQNDAFLCDALLAETEYYLGTNIISAESPARKAVEIANKIGDKYREAMALGILGEWACYRYDHQTGRDKLKEAIALFEQVGDTGEADRFLHGLSIALGYLSEYDQLLVTAKAAVELSKVRNNQRQEAIGLRRIAIAYFHQHQYQDALDYGMQALRLHNKIGDQREAINAIHVIGILYAWLGDLENAHDYFQKAVDLAKLIGHQGGIYRGIVDQGPEYFLPLGEYWQWLQLLEAEIKEARLNSDLWLMENWIWEKANLLSRYGKLHEAVDLYHSILQSAADVLGEYEIAQIYYQLSLALSNLGDGDLAFQAYSKAPKVYQESSNPLEKRISLYFLLEINLITEDQTSIQDTLHRLCRQIDLTRNHYDYVHTGACLELAARAFLKLGNLEKAFEYSSESLLNEHLVPYANDIERKYLTHSNILFELDREKEAREYLQKAYERVMLIAQKTEDDELRLSWLENAKINREIIEEYGKRFKM